MDYLLDTHTAIWLLEDDNRLSSNAMQIIEDSSVKCFISIASLWEMTIKAGLGKLQLPVVFEELINALFVNDIQILNIQFNDLRALRNLPLHHKDPFDRILIAQAIASDFTLISLDPQFHYYPVKILW